MWLKPLIPAFSLGVHHYTHLVFTQYVVLLSSQGPNMLGLVGAFFDLCRMMTPWGEGGIVWHCGLAKRSRCMVTSNVVR